MAAAELGPFERNFLRAAGQQSEQIALDIAQLLDVGADRGVVNGPDGSGLADIHEQQHAAHFAELLLKQRLQFVHGERGAVQVLRIGIIGENERILAARHSTVPCPAIRMITVSFLPARRFRKSWKPLRTAAVVAFSSVSSRTLSPGTLPPSGLSSSLPNTLASASANCSDSSGLAYFEMPTSSA